MFIVEVQCQKPVTGHWTVYISTQLMLLVLSIDTYLLTYSMEQSPSREANQFSGCQEIPRILWNPTTFTSTAYPLS